MRALAIAFVLAALTLAATAMGMARAQEAAEIWYIHGAITLGETQDESRLVVRGPDGAPALLTFSSKAECDTARQDDPEIAGPLAQFVAGVLVQGGSVVVTCERFVHPPAGQEI